MSEGICLFYLYAGTVVTLIYIFEKILNAFDRCTCLNINVGIELLDR